MKNPLALLGLAVFAAFEPELARVFFTSARPLKAQKRILELEAENKRLRDYCSVLFTFSGVFFVLMVVAFLA